MKSAEASIYLDKNRPKKNGKSSVKVKITYNRKRKYFATGIDLFEKDFDQILFGKRRSKPQKEIKKKLDYFINKADEVIGKLKVFSFAAFEEIYTQGKNANTDVFFAFDKYINELRLENRIGTAVSYECAKRSIQSFKKNLTFAEVSKSFLERYERWMLSKDKSKATIGIYLRSLRSVYNGQNFDNNIYPFGSNKNQYSIPTGKNTKKALTVEEIARIYNYKADSGSTKEMAKDYWLFLYLCNGMNVKDFCLLKWENINQNMLSYKRSKTKRSKKEERSISVALKAESLAIIKKWGQKSLNPKDYIFPHLSKNLDAVQERGIYQQLTKTINKYMKQIAAELDIEKNVTTYFARHSFATVLKRSGAKIEMISELLGHSSVDVTESYLDSFENEQIQEQTEALTAGFKEAN